MKRIALGVAGAVALAAAALFSPTGSAMAPPLCEAKASAAWDAAGRGFFAEAHSLGANCSTAVVVVTVRNGQDEPVYVHASPASWILTFDGIATAPEMEQALASWIDQSASQMKTTADLPAWAEGADQPMLGDFPFYFDGETTRDDYEALRAASQPLFCYVQGRESMACAALNPATGEMTKVGMQSFPG